MMRGSAWILSRRFGDRFAAETLAKSKISLLSYSSFNLALHYAAGSLSGPAAVGVCALLAIGVSACVACGRHAGWFRCPPAAPSMSARTAANDAAGIISRLDS